MALVAALPFPVALRRLPARLAALLRTHPRPVPTATGHGRDASLPQAWLLALPVFLPAFFLAGAPSARAVLQLLAAFAAVALLALGARTLPGRWRTGRLVPDPATLLGLLAAVAAAVPLGSGFLVTCLLIGALLVAAGLPAARANGLALVTTAVCGALAADAGTIALGTGRGIELVALGGALALFCRLADEGPTLILRPGSRRRPGTADLLREGALALAVLVALVAYLALLSVRAGTVGVLGIDGWAALLVFGACLALAWHRGRQRPGALCGDPVVLAAAALASLVTAATSASAPGFPLP